jgi:hypothetical protein
MAADYIGVKCDYRVAEQRLSPFARPVLARGVVGAALLGRLAVALGV